MCKCLDVYKNSCSCVLACLIPSGPSSVFKIVKMIMERNFQPVIIFSFSKKECEAYALQVAKLDFNRGMCICAAIQHTAFILTYIYVSVFVVIFTRNIYLSLWRFTTWVVVQQVKHDSALCNNPASTCLVWVDKCTSAGGFVNFLHSKRLRQTLELSDRWEVMGLLPLLSFSSFAKPCEVIMCDSEDSAW